VNVGAPSDCTLEVEGLRVELAGSGVDIVDDVSFRIDAGEVFSLVGESGCGKTSVGLAVLGYARRGARLAGGSIRIGGRDLLGLPENELRTVRGRDVSYVPQDPSVSLNPAIRIGAQLKEALEVHDFGDAASRQSRIMEMLDEVKLPGDRGFLRRYPHELSGGQQQRVALAMAFACRPRVIVLDEPTTGLDVTTQAHILDTVRELCSAHGVAALYITHDLAVVAQLSARLGVMYGGRMVEMGPRAQLFGAAAHPYTRSLMAAIPDISGRYALEGIPGRPVLPQRRPAGCLFAARCEFARDGCREGPPALTKLSPEHAVRCFRAEHVLALSTRERSLVDQARAPEREVPVLSVRGLSASYGDRCVVEGVDLDVWRHGCVALVGESGSGKTTLARCIAGIHQDFTGEIRLDGLVLAAGTRSRPREVRQQIQYIFQNPYSSLNPRKTIGQIIAEPLSLFFDLDRRERLARIESVLERVSLSGDHVGRYPDQLSGGERQRVAIARALAAEPRVLVCDEVTSALDASVQASLIGLLRELKQDIGLSLLFVTHNLALVANIAEDVVVMNDGHIVESGRVETVLATPSDAYTRDLLAHTLTAA
jgi:peptide/nickel transport system ATP-binding protein